MATEIEEFYRSLREGDRRFDGKFFAAVITTGVYCRSVCPVPRPAKRENVRFFPSAAAAQQAEFRPCQTCRPERSAGTPPWGDLPPVVSRALLLIGEGSLDEGSLEDLAGRLGTTSRHLRRLFREHLGAPPIAIAKARRTHYARRLIDETDLPMSEIAFASGFQSIRQFNQDVRATFGRPPSELRQRKPRRPPRDDATFQTKLFYRPPLDWARLIRFLQARATPGVEVAEHHRYRRTIEVEGAPGAIEIEVTPTEPYLLLRGWLPSSKRLRWVSERARRLFDLDADPLVIGSHLQRSALLRRSLRARPGLRVPQAWDPFELAVRAVLGQQISVRAATTLATRMVQSFGKPVESLNIPGLTHLFPAPETLAGADLTEIGATGAQARTIRSLAGCVADGTLLLESPRGLEDFVHRICELPGIGSWTAHYIAMRALGEPDAFPAADLGLRRAARGDDPLSAKELERVAEDWRPWRAYAAMYLWTMQSKRTTQRRRTKQ